MTAGRKSSVNKTDWNTPPKILSKILNFWKYIDLDPCSNEYSLVNANTKFFLEDDGLCQDWNKYSTIFINPPYGRGIYSWIYKASLTNSEIIMLIPVATNTKHFKELVFNKFNNICFLSDTRLKFYNQGKEDKKGAPMACCLIYKGTQSKQFKSVFESLGKTISL